MRNNNPSSFHSSTTLLSTPSSLHIRLLPLSMHFASVENGLWSMPSLSFPPVGPSNRVGCRRRLQKGNVEEEERAGKGRERTTRPAGATIGKQKARVSFLRDLQNW
jgi:hypothetical protein